MIILELESVSWCLASAAAAFRAFLWASFSARFWASTERVEVAAARASVGLLIPSRYGKGGGVHLLTRASHTCPGGISAANLDISSLCRQTRSTTSSSYQHANSQ